MNGNNKRIIEAALFASSEPISVTKMSEYLDGDRSNTLVILRELQKDYDGRGVNLIDIEGKFVFRTATDLSDSLTIEKHVNKSLSRAAMETLAIIAYHQPVTRAEIENIRGVSTNKGTLDTLMGTGWIKPGRRRETLGRPLTWVTTTDFLDHFSLESLMDLPGMDEMKASGLLDRRPAIEIIHHQVDLFSSDVEDGENTSETGQEENESVDIDGYEGTD